MTPTGLPPSPAPGPRRRLLRAAALLLALAAGSAPAAPEPAAPEPVLTLLSFGGSAELLAGLRAAGGDPVSPPTFRWHASRDGDAWGPLRPLEPSALGLPVALRGAPWRLETAGLGRDGSPHHRLLPMTGELGLVGGRMEALLDVESVRIAPTDEWSVAMLEQSAQGALLLRRISCEGPDSAELQVNAQLDFATGWPPGTRVVAFDAGPDVAWAFGRRDATVEVATLPPRQIPSLDLSANALVSGALMASGPAVVSLEGGRLSVHVLGEAGWSLAGQTGWPARDVGVLIARAIPPERSELIVATASAAGPGPCPVVTAASFTASGFSAPATLEDGQALAPPGAVASPEAVPPPEGLSSKRWLLIAAAATSLLAFGVAALEVRAILRRRRQQ